MSELDKTVSQKVPTVVSKPAEPVKQHDNTAKLPEGQTIDTTRATVGKVEKEETSNKIIDPNPANKIKKGGLIPDGKGGRKWVSIEEEAAYLQQKADRETMNKR